MTKHDASESLPEELRKEVFLALVEARDQKVSVVQSRKLITGRFGVGERPLRRIEEEGMEHGWPPL